MTQKTVHDTTDGNRPIGAALRAAMGDLARRRRSQNPHRVGRTTLRRSAPKALPWTEATSPFQGVEPRWGGKISARGNAPGRKEAASFCERREMRRASNG